MYVKQEWRSTIAKLLILVLLVSTFTIAGQSYAAIDGPTAGKVQGGESAPTFTDIEDSYARTEIGALVEKQILSGFEDGTFRPRQAMTRAQLAKILALSLNLKEDPQAAAFADVKEDAWYSGYVGALVRSGITQGTTASTFSPDQEVTREELAVFFIRALNLEKTALDLDVQAQVADGTKIADWARPYVGLAFKIGFLQGIERGGALYFDPKAHAERQALARLAYEFVMSAEKLSKKAKELADSLKGKPSVSPSPSVKPSATPGVPVVGGGGGGGVPPITEPTPNGNMLTFIEAKTYEGDYTIAPGVSLAGPENGKAVFTGKLQLDPGSSGELTLRNVEAANLEVLSGASQSIRLKGVKVNVSLLINAAKQPNSVRVISEEGTAVAATQVQSNAIVESAAGSFGNILITGTTGRTEIELRGSIDGTVTVASEASRLKLTSGSRVNKLNVTASSVSVDSGGQIGEVALNGVNSFFTLAAGSSVGVLQIGGNATITANGSIESIQVARPDIIIDLQGTERSGLVSRTAAKAEEAIQALPEPAVADLGAKTAVKTARMLVNGTLALDKSSAISNITKLVALEKKIRALLLTAVNEALAAIPDASAITPEQIESVTAKILLAKAAAEAALEEGIQDAEFIGWARIEAAEKRIQELREQGKEKTLVTSNALYEGQLRITGTTNPGASITLNSEEGSLLGSTAASGKGAFTISFPESVVPKAGETYLLTATASGKEETQILVTVLANVGRTSIPSVERIFEDDFLIRGGVQPDSLITVRWAGHTYTTYATGGSYRIVFGLYGSKPKAGETVEITAQANGKAVSDTVKAEVWPIEGKTSRPTAMVPLYAGVNDTLYVSASPNTEILVIYNDRYLTASSSGISQIPVSQWKLEEGDIVKIIAKAYGKAASEVVDLVVAAPLEKTAAPTDLAILNTSNGVFITGKSEVNSSLTLSNSEGIILNRASNPDGNFVLGVNDPSLAPGDKLYVTATAWGKPTSEAVELTFPDESGKTPAPIVNGYGIAGAENVVLHVQLMQPAIITVRSADGKVLHAGFMTSWNSILVSGRDMKAGDALLVTAKSAGRAESTPWVFPILAANGQTAVPTFTGDIFTNGISLSGQTEPNAIWTFKSDDGKAFAYGYADSNGIFEVRFRMDFKAGSKVALIAEANGKTASESVHLTVKEVQGKTDRPLAAGTVYESHILDWENRQIIVQTGMRNRITVKTDKGGAVYEGINEGQSSLWLPSSLVYKGGDKLLVTAEEIGKAPSDPSELEITALQGVTDKPTVTGSVYEEEYWLQVKTTVTSRIVVKSSAGVIADYISYDNGQGSILTGIPFKLLPGETVEVFAKAAGKQVSEGLPVIVQPMGVTEAPAVAKAVLGMDQVTGYVEGQAEPNAAISAKKADGTSIGSSSADSQGYYKVTFNSGYGLQLGDKIYVTAKARGKRVGSATEAALSAPEKTSTPTVTGTVYETDAAIRQSQYLTGKAEPGAYITVKNGMGIQIGSVYAGYDGGQGTYTIYLDSASVFVAGETLTVTAKKDGKIASDAVPYVVLANQGQTTVPTVTGTVYEDEFSLKVKGNNEETVYVTVKVEGNIVAATSLYGIYETEISRSDLNLVAGQHVEIAAKAYGKQWSSSVILSAQALQGAAETPIVEEFTYDTQQEYGYVTGKSQPGADVSVKTYDGITVGRTKADKQGKYALSIYSVPLSVGNKLYLTAKLSGYRASVPYELEVLAPLQTKRPTVTTSVYESDGASWDWKTINGKAEPNSDLFLKKMDGGQLDSARASDSGDFSLYVDWTHEFYEGEQLLLTSKKNGKQASEPAVITVLAYTETSNDLSVTGSVYENELKLTVFGKAGDRLVVKSSGKHVADFMLSYDGENKLTATDLKLTAGETVYVRAKQSGKKLSNGVPLTVQAMEKTGAPVINKVSYGAGGSPGYVFGTAEPGAQIYVQLPDGYVTGAGVADSQGVIQSFLSTSNLTIGQNVLFTARAFGKSLSEAVEATVTAPDQTDKPTILGTVYETEGTGQYLAGVTEPGAWITVKGADGGFLGSVGADLVSGEFQVFIQNGNVLRPGDELTVVAKHDGKSFSDPVTLTVAARNTVAGVYVYPV